MLRLLVLGNDRNEAVPEAIRRFERWVPGRAEIVAIDLKGDLDLSTVEADLAVIFGGDGSILGVSRRLGENPIPVVGVNFGKFGFLAEVRAAEMERALERILSGDYVERRRMLMLCRVRRADGPVEECTALNDCVLGSARLSRMVHVHLHVDDEHATEYAGDGLIVATPVGSTAHSLAAGGPIVEPTLDAFVLTPVAPHSLTNRSLVIPPTVRIEMRTEDIREGGHVSIDGQVDFDLGPDDVLEIVRAPRDFRIWQTGQRSYYEILRTRLFWRGTPNYEP
jgi:NAD+ kinase